MKRTQKERVLEALKEGQALTPMDCFRWMPPITRLAAVVWELRQDGHDIRTAEVETPNATFARYTLPDEGQLTLFDRLVVDGAAKMLEGV